MLPRIGEDAPDFDVLASSGERLSLRDFRGKRSVVLFFYPKDFTSVCTAETCGFRDMHDELEASDVAIIGVSLDTDESHRRFADQHGVRFPLVADRDKSLTRKYGAIGTVRSLLGLAKRVTFVIDKQGKIAGVFEGELSARPHLQGVRDVVAKLG